MAAEAGGDAAAGKKVAAMCQVFQGLDGIAKNPDAPNLAGRKEIYLVRSPTAFKAGERDNEHMAVASRALSEADIADLAAYCAAIKIAVQVPP